MTYDPTISLGSIIATIAVAGSVVSTGVASYYAIKGHLTSIDNRLASGDKRFEEIDTRWKEAMTESLTRHVRLEERIEEQGKILYRMLGVLDRRVDDRLAQRSSNADG